KEAKTSLSEASFCNTNALLKSGLIRRTNGHCVPFAIFSVLIIATASINGLLLLQAGIEPNPGPEQHDGRAASGIANEARESLDALNKQHKDTLVDTTRRWMILVIGNAMYPSLMSKQVWNSIRVKEFVSRKEMKHTPCYVMCGDVHNVKLKALDKSGLLQWMKLTDMDILKDHKRTLKSRDEIVSLKQTRTAKSDKVTTPREHGETPFHNCTGRNIETASPFRNQSFRNGLFDNQSQDQNSVHSQPSDDGGPSRLAVTSSSRDIPMQLEHPQQENYSFDNLPSLTHRNRALDTTFSAMPYSSHQSSSDISYRMDSPSFSNSASVNTLTTNTLGHNFGRAESTFEFSRTNDVRFGNPNSQPVEEFQSTIRNKPQLPRPRYPDYVEKDARLRSFSTWSMRQPDSSTLAKTGFFFTGKYDLVRCFQCGIGLKDFSSTDDPLKEHVQHSEKCAYLLQYFGGREQLLQYKENIRDLEPEQIRQRQFEEFRNAQGIDDHVRCFACDGGLRRWDPEDDPWIEHCRWFPACPFARQQKGDEYIALVQASIDQDIETFLPETQPSNSASALTGAMANLSVDDSLVQRVIDANIDVITNAMGYPYDDFKESVVELRQQGNTNPSTEDIVTAIEIINERKEIASHQPSPLNGNTKESVFKENERLKSLLTCFQCQENQVNALFLPCTHHKLCMGCAEEYTSCPVCQRPIQQKIRTFMG
ncbi:PIAP-like protein, partial [Mya arenaria]